MKKVTRLLILTAFVFPLLTMTRAYAGGPGPGQRITTLERDRIGLDPLGVQQHTDPFNTDVRNDGWHPTESANNPLHLQDPIGDPRPDIDRDDLFHHSILGDHDRDHFPGAGRPGWDNGNGGGGTAPIDGGISLLLAAGLGLGIRKARARKQNV